MLYVEISAQRDIVNLVEDFRNIFFLTFKDVSIVYCIRECNSEALRVTKSAHK